MSKKILECQGKDDKGCGGTSFKIIKNKNKVMVVCLKCKDVNKINDAFEVLSDGE